MTEPKACPLCTADASMVEHLKAGVFFCNSCGQCFMLNAAGALIGRHATNHNPRRDVSGHEIDGD